MDFKGMTMSQLIEAHNALATEKGRPHETEFKNLAAARAAITDLENLNMTETVQQDPAVGDTAPAADGAAPAATSGDPSKYSTVGKRGPTQGVGEFAKELLKTGMATADVLTKVKEQFPTAKTSASCIAYYKAALKNPNLGKRKGSAATTDPAALRAKAKELMDAATAAEAANAEAAVAAAKKAVEDAEKAKAVAEAAVAAQKALAEQAAANAQVQPQA